MGERIRRDDKAPIDLPITLEFKNCEHDRSSYELD